MASTQKGRENVGKIGVPLSDLWEWRLGYRVSHTSSEFGASQALQIAYTWAAMVEEKKLQLAQSLGRSWPLERQLLWPVKEIPQRLKAKKR